MQNRRKGLPLENVDKTQYIQMTQGEEGGVKPFYILSNLLTTTIVCNFMW